MPTPLFYIFALIMLAGGIGVVALKNPVSSAFSMIVSFIGLAALLVGLNAYFVGILQVLVYTGAVMVLFLFIIMLLDLKKEEERSAKHTTIAAGIVIPLLLALQLVAVLQVSDFGSFPEITKDSLQQSELIIAKDNPELSADSTIRHSMREQGKLPDVNLIGQRLFTQFNLPLQIIGILLLVATIGCVSLSKKLKPRG